MAPICLTEIEPPAPQGDRIAQMDPVAVQMQVTTVPHEIQAQAVADQGIFFPVVGPTTLQPEMMRHIHEAHVPDLADPRRRQHRGALRHRAHRLGGDGGETRRGEQHGGEISPEAPERPSHGAGAG